METSPRFENLLAVPSMHCDPIFAARVRRAFDEFAPTAVAVELPAELALELAWGVECWPQPVASLYETLVVPFVPGDSMYEAYRLARERDLPVQLVDIPVDAWRHASLNPATGAWPEPECAERVGALFEETIAAVSVRDGPSTHDLVREEWMARRLAEMIRAHERVLWVGGAAHWARMRARLASGAAPLAEQLTSPRGTFSRVRLSGSALERTTRRLPYLVERYARDPAGYDENVAIRALSLEAVPDLEGRSVVLVRDDRRVDDSLSESASPADVARMLAYARNLAMCSRLGDRPDLVQLLTAASAVIGNRYAGRLFVLAMHDRPSAATAELPVLDFRCDDQRSTFRIDDREVELRPYVELRPSGRARPVRITEVERRREDLAYRELSAEPPDAKRLWKCLPPDEQAYEAFVQYVLRRASITDPAEARSAPFQSGLRDGVDVRATVRDWRDGNVFVRETHPTRLHVTNGLVDFVNDTELTPMLQGDGPRAGWADPSLLHVGSASWNHRNEVLQREPCLAHRMHRALSLITLDAPTAHPDEEKTFYARVIRLLLKRTSGDLYSWLEVMFEFCARKPFAYFSRYVPSVRVHRLAAAYGVRVVHQPLRRIPRRLLERNSSFRFLNVTRQQWDEVTRNVAEARGAWGLGDRA